MYIYYTFIVLKSLTEIGLSLGVDMGGWGQTQLGVASCLRQEVGGASRVCRG